MSKVSPYLSIREYLAKVESLYTIMHLELLEILKKLNVVKLVKETLNSKSKRKTSS